MSSLGEIQDLEGIKANVDISQNNTTAKCQLTLQLLYYICQWLVTKMLI